MAEMISPVSLPAPSDPSADLARLHAWIGQFGSALVAYSGGVDSALVMAVAHQRLGPRALACIGVSPSYPERELRAATDLAEKLGANCRLVDTREHLDPRYAANPTDRCYFCKSELYDRLRQVATAEGFAVILDGTNASDLNEDRPGYRAARQSGVRSPLAELELTKQRVRELARELGLPVWDKPSMPCLSSRVPHGTAIVPELLKRIERAEDVLVRLGFRQFRVRHHGEVARIELPEEDLARAVEKRGEIVEGVRAAGYRFVSLDLGGFQSGSISRSLSPVLRGELPADGTAAVAQGGVA